MLTKFGLLVNEVSVHKEVWTGNDNLSKEAFSIDDDKDENLLFEAINSIMFTKKHMVVEGENINWYNQRIVNKALSQHIDTILFAHNMNMMFEDAGNIKIPILSDQMHFDYLFECVRPAKRYTKWAKLYDDLEQRLFTILVSSYYQINRDKALDYIKIFSDEQISRLKKVLAPKALADIEELLKGFTKKEIQAVKKQIQQNW